MFKRGFTNTEIAIGCGLALTALVIVFLFFNNLSVDTVGRTKQTAQMLQEAVKYAEGETNLKSTQWDYSLSPNEFFKKYISDHLNYSYLLERNLEYNDDSTVFYAYFVNESYMILKKNECMEYHYDANGVKKPNILGEDQFIFYLCPQEHAAKNNFVNIKR